MAWGDCELGGNGRLLTNLVETGKRSVARFKNRPQQPAEDRAAAGNNSCDGIECDSVTWILTSDTGRQLIQFGLRPHYPVYQFKQIADDLIYAFTPDSLLVIDISRINDPIVIDEISLTK